MKVEIGPYLDWWGPYQILKLLTYLGFSEDTTDGWAEKSPQWFTDVCQWIENKRKRKIKIKIDKYDTWGMDSTLALIIIPMLKQLKATKHGIPGSMFVEEDGENGYGYSEATMAKAEAKWDMIIDHMMWSFKQVLDEEHDAFTIVKGKLDFKDYPEDEGKGTRPLRWEREYEMRWDAYHAYHERIQEGLDLFSKHYKSLWD